MKWKRHIIALAIVVVVSFLFLWKLFFPQLRLIATPEFELHDAIQLSYASKWWYAQKLHTRDLPIWSSQIGMGFPMLGEGQTGIFFLPNIIFFGMLKNPALAYNLVLTLVPITLSFGTYLWFSMHTIPFFLSLLGGLTMGLSGFTLFHLQHLSLLQGFSLIPIGMAATLGMTRDKPKPWVFLFIIIISQQLFTGFIQSVVIGCFFSFSYYFFLLWKTPQFWKRLWIYAGAIIGVIGVSAIQFLPSLEFLRQISPWERTNPDWPMQYSFPIKFLISFLHPFLLGNPRFGTYKGSGDPGAIFWENIAYIGIVPLIFFLYGVWVKKIRKKNIFFIFTLVSSFFLMLGKFSPFYFIFNFFPLNLFRVPSRFIYVFAISILVIAIKASAEITKSKMERKNKLKQIGPIRLMVLLLWGANLLLLYPLWTNYHALKTPAEIHEAPAITPLILEDAYILRFNVNNSQRRRYFAYGWTDMKRYDFYKNTFMPNTNVFWNKTISDAYPSRFLKRPAILDGLFLGAVSEDKTTATMSAAARNFLSLSPTTTILSEIPIDSEGNYKLVKTLTDDDASLYIYSVGSTTPWAFFPTSWHVFTTISDMKKIINDPTISFQTSVLLEKNISIPTVSNNNKPEYILTKRTDTNIVFTGKNISRDSLFTIAQTYYPGWIAWVDGKKTEIFPVNIRNMGIIVPNGTTTIEFQYTPKSFIWGTVISIISFIATIVLLLF